MTVNGKMYRLKSRIRFMVFVMLSIILFVSAANTLLGFNDASSMTRQEYLKLHIQSGDTLWSIATEYMSDQMDTRKAVYTLCQINDISADALQPGQVILIPIDM